MRILLIEPPFARFMGFYRFFFPFSLASLAAYLKKDGHQILIYDADHNGKPANMTSTKLLNVFPKYIDGIKNLHHPIWQEVENVIKDFNPDLIGITYLSTKTGSVKNIVNISKRLYPQVPIVLGGAHASVLFKSSLEQSQADFVVLGEGEKTFSELIQKIQSGNTDFENIPGLAFKSAQGKIITTPHRELLKDLDSLPFPDRDSLYRLETYRPDDLSMIMTSRGCPYNCAFCSSIWERRARDRSILNIVAEIEYLIERFKTKNIYFKDDTFTLSRKRIFEFCNTLEQKNIQVDWECLTRIELIDKELIMRMRRAGMVYLKIGIESGSQRLLDAANKNVTISEIKKGAAILNKLGQKWSAFFMIGYPDETETEIHMSHKLIEEIRPTYVSMSTLVPYPGCQYYYELKDLGVLNKNTNWNLYDPFSIYANVNQVIDKKRFQTLVYETMKFIDDYNLHSGEKSPKISRIKETANNYERKE